MPGPPPSNNPSNRFDPNEFLSVAKSLDPSGSNAQGFRRTILGRAYYAAFLAAREKVRRKFPSYFAGPAGKEAVHLKVQDLLKTWGYSNIANKLYALGQWRVKADYFLDGIIELREIDEMIKLAENIMKLVDGISYT